MKTKPLIWINTIIKNEERWIWFAINSVLPFIDKILIWDTGSSDNTVEIIRAIRNDKIIFREIGLVAQKDFGLVRQKMLEQTKSQWVWILDGDEIWPKDSALQLIKEIKKASKDIHSFCVRPINFVGDIRFIHPETFQGQTPYGPKGLKGFFSTRIFRKNILGLHASGEYGKESFYNKDNLTLRAKIDHVKYLPNIYYWHMDYLPRSSCREKDKEVMMRAKKRKYELGKLKPSWIKIPEVFYLSRPTLIKDPFYKMDGWEYIKSFIQTPLKRIKRTFFKLFVEDKA